MPHFSSDSATWQAIFLAVAVHLAAVVPSAMGAEEVVIRSGPERAQLIELFTSEGCSSCPPAERWLGELRKDPRLWKSIVPVAFHVDYWDGLGWKDRLARPEWTARQRAYSAAWGTASVYTPGFVVDGREWRGWFERGALPTGKARAGTLEARAAGDSVTVRFEPEGKLANASAHAAWLSLEVVSDVRSGENSGRSLRHDFAALSHGVEKLTAAGDGAWSAQLRLPRPAKNAGALAVWIESGGVPLQAAGGWVAKDAASK